MSCACGACRECRMREFGQARRKYHFTEELRDELRRVYCGNRAEIAAGLDRLMRRTGWPRHAFIFEASRLRIATRQRRIWSAAETEYLAEHLGQVSVTQIARNLGRSVQSIESRAERLRFSRRAAEGYTAEDLQRVFGASYYTVRRWMERGLLGKIHDVQGRRVTTENVLRFARKHPHEYDLRRVDQTWYKAMLFGDTTPQCGDDLAGEPARSGGM
jgi:DNA-directed RNA polymerase specialized sigma24 family protein